MAPEPGDLPPEERDPGAVSQVLTIGSPPTIPIGKITVTDCGVWMTFDPLEDITAYELALLVTMFLKLTMGNPTGIPDWRGYLKEHNLERHFKPV